jgi:hypothetical protein
MFFNSTLVNNDVVVLGSSEPIIILFLIYSKTRLKNIQLRDEVGTLI